ncbi:short-chain dehydrogenase [Flavobacterium rivuli WB 3.3-2 = DSM 21788]|uniref:Short-chain dehydrogenase n=1 Tax=Flavobacterium rivuli WB 3.3-2 = DSM 21788 TaxID=1121895 RepID=A0A0A2LXE9_9FLAO|nr:SDR family NAD(P)-dependent oxidoreductase [Flavobacterium rivuli]KGO85057.1 short-chain dehydrogenase [Flavobacterium rivuli WB 3.3-2 = DSM 21788]
MSTNKTWFITGASKGFGLLFVQQLLAKGDNVAATSRSIADLETAAGTHPNFLPLEVDLTNEQNVATAINATVDKFGKLDVVVNNAGYGLLGTLEELSDAESRGNFEVNVFGLLNVIRQAMTHLRTQGSGHIFNISSIGGFTGNFPGFGIYCATKFAVAGLSESLAAEVKEFGINVTIVLPGYFRTSFLEAGSLAVPKNTIEAYKSTRESQEAHQKQINGNQAGDPEKGVAEIIKVADAPNPPLYLFLGSDAVSLAHTKIAAVDTEIAEWRSVSVSTDF